MNTVRRVKESNKLITNRAVKKHGIRKNGLIEKKQARQKHKNKAFAELAYFLRDKSGLVGVIHGTMRAK